MTDTATKVRSLFLTALMVVSVFGGTVAFAGTAAAAANVDSITADPATVGDTSTHTVKGIAPSSNEDSSSLNGIVIDYSVGSAPASVNNVGSGDVTVLKNGTDITSDVDGVSASNNGETLTISLGGNTQLQTGDNVTVVAQNVENPGSSGDFDVDVDLNPQSTNDPVTGTITYSTGAEGNAEVTQGPVEFAAETDGDTSNGQENHIEVVFDRDIDKSDVQAFVTDQSGQTTQITAQASSLEADNSLIFNTSDLSGDATIVVNSTSTDLDTGELDVTTTSSTVQRTSTSNDNTTAFDGEQVAIVSTTQGEGFEAFDSNDNFLFSRSLGSNSVVAVVDSGSQSSLSAGETYTVEFQSSSGTTEYLTLRNLGLTAEADSTDVTYQSGSAAVSATIESNSADRQVVATLLDSNGGEVSSQTVTIDGDGAVTAEFDVSSEGNYTVEAEDVNTGITAETDSVVVSQVEGAASFSNSVFSVDRGDVAEITVDLDNADTAYVNIGSADVNYVVQVEVEDGNDDGEVTLEFNTRSGATGSADAVSAAADDDSASFSEKTTTKSSNNYYLDSASYDVNVSLSQDGAEESVATLSVNERSTDGITIGTAPASEFGEADNATDVEYTEDSTIAAGDVLVHEVSVSGVYGYVQDQIADDSNDIDTAEEALLELNSLGTVDLVILQTSGTTDANEDPKVVDLAATNDADALNVYADDDSNTLFVNVDTANAVFDRADRDTYTDVSDNGGFTDGNGVSDVNTNAETGDEFDVSFTIDSSDSLVSGNEDETVSSSFEVVEQSASFDTDNDEVTVQNTEGQSISGTTSVAAGTNLTVRVRATGDSPFLKTTEVTVQEDGTFSGTFDFSDVSENVSFTASVRSIDDTETDGVVAPAPTASVSISDQTTDGTTVTVESASLSEGGFVTIHDGSLADGAVFDSVRGTSAYLEAGSSSDIEVSLDAPYESDGTVIAMPHMDTNGNEAYDFVSSDGAEDGPYTADGAAVTDRASLTVETGEDATPTPTPSPSPTPDDGETPTDETPDTATDTPGQPGFGAALAIVALAGAALLALRRE